MRRIIGVIGVVALLGTAGGCAWNSAQHGRYDGVRSAQWAGGVPAIGLRFDRERYMTDKEYREAFDFGVENSRAFTWPWFSDSRAKIREMLHLDELRAQAEARERGEQP
jgi:hypothetical protein